MSFPSEIFFNEIDHGYWAPILKEIFLWLLLFCMAEATYCYYEKVRRTMRTAIVSYLLKWTLKVIKVFQINLLWNFSGSGKNILFGNCEKFSRKTSAGLINYHPLCFKIKNLRTGWINRCLSVPCLLKR